MSAFPPRPPTSASPSIAVIRANRSESEHRVTTPGGTSTTNGRAVTPILGELPIPIPPSSSARQTTPNKAKPRVNSRDGTPNKEMGGKGVRARPSSAGRAGLTLVKAAFEVQHQYRERSQSTRNQVSTRKLRRWENDHPAMAKEDIVSMLGDKDSDPVSQGPTVDWRSLFSKLFLQANWHSMDDFRQCRGAGAGNTQTTATTNRRLRHDYWSEAEAAWLKVEKRLRVAVQETLYVKTDMLAFVQSLEAVLMYFSEKLTALPVHLTPPLLADMIAEPLSVENRVQKASSSKAKKTTKTTPIAIAEATTATATEIASSAIVTAADVTAKVYDIKPAAPAKRCSLKVNIKDSPHAAFYRIFVHATSQFYGFQSRSVNEKSGARVTLITPPTRVTAKNTPMLHAQLSLAAFLAVVTNEAQDVAVVDSSTVASTITTGNLPDISMMMD